MKEFVDEYKSSLMRVVEKIDYRIIDRVVFELDRIEKNKNRVFVIGNGGSSATASHMVNDLGVGLKRRGILNLDINSLSDNIPTITAISNDIGYSDIYSQQLNEIAMKGDLLIAISCSGDSENIIKAVEYAKNIEMVVVGLTGFDGGKLRALSDISYHVETKKGEYGLVEDMHMIFDHLIYSYYISR